MKNVQNIRFLYYDKKLDRFKYIIYYTLQRGIKMKNKNVIGLIFAIIIFVIIIVICIAVNKGNNEPNNTMEGMNSEKNIDENKSLNNISFNDIKIGDLIQEEMKNLVMDAQYLYEYENININVDSNDNIIYLGFITTTNAEGEKTKSINDIDIKYNNNKLETITDFKENIGNGTETEKNDEGDYYINYYDDELELSIFVKNNEIYNIILQEKD